MIPVLLKACAFFGVVGLSIIDTVGYIARVDGASMKPSLKPKDWVLVNKWAVRNYEVSRGDIVVLISPKDPNERFIKRVIGIEGDLVPTPNYKTETVTVPEGHCWIEGDNNVGSIDSNLFGPISLGLITAKAMYIIWPPSRLSRL